MNLHDKIVALIKELEVEKEYYIHKYDEAEEKYDTAKQDYYIAKYYVVDDHLDKLKELVDYE